jgi:hypothetical protein
MDAIIPTYKNNFMTAVLICIFTAVLLSQTGAEAKTLVTGEYASSSGNKIVLNLHILNPAPANLIVEQYISPKNSIVSTSPKAKKGSAGKIKWLFRNTVNGTISISIQLQSSLKGKVRAVVRYRDPVSGDFVESDISP